jgi:protease II
MSLSCYSRITKVETLFVFLFFVDGRFLGTDPATCDELLYVEGDEAYALSLHTTNNQKYFLLVVTSGTQFDIHFYSLTSKLNDLFFFFSLTLSHSHHFFV